MNNTITIKEKELRKIVYECVLNALQKNQRLDEMARVGIMDGDTYDVIVFTDDNENGDIIMPDNTIIEPYK